MKLKKELNNLLSEDKKNLAVELSEIQSLIQQRVKEEKTDNIDIVEKLISFQSKWFSSFEKCLDTFIELHTERLSEFNLLKKRIETLSGTDKE